MEMIQADYKKNFVLKYNEKNSITIIVNVSDKSEYIIQYTFRI